MHLWIPFYFIGVAILANIMPKRDFHAYETRIYTLRFHTPSLFDTFNTFNTFKWCILPSYEYIYIYYDYYHGCWWLATQGARASAAILMTRSTRNDPGPQGQALYDDVVKWKHFPRYWPFVRGIHRSPHKGHWRGALMFSLICVWINGWVNNGEAGDLRRYRAHYDVTVMDHRAW